MGQAQLSSWMGEWVTLTAGRYSTSTLRSYVTDVTVFSEALADALGRSGDDPGEIPAPPADFRGEPLLPESAWERLFSATSHIQLADLTPRNTAQALDRLSVTRSASSVHRASSAFANLAQLLVRREMLETNPVKHPSVERPRKPKLLPHPIPEDSIRAVLQTIVTPDTAARQPWPERDLALAALLISTGIRVSEACSVAVGDRYRQAGVRVLRVYGKGRKHRTVPLTPEADAAVDAYLESRNERLGSPDPNSPLIVRSDGTAFTSRSMRRLVDRWYARAGVRGIEGASVHSWRHAFASLAIADGAGVVEVQALLGHEHLDTTSRYLAVSGVGVMEAVHGHRSRSMLSDASS